MSTRSLVYIKETEKGAPFICIYRQCDGYPTGMGKDLLNLLKGYKLVNGFNTEHSACAICDKQAYEHPGEHSMKNATALHPFMMRRFANGISCLAATIIKGLKDSVGNVYLYPPSTKDAEQAYEYSLWVEKHGILMLRVGTPSYGGKPGKVLYSGPLDSFSPEEAEEKNKD